jgi:CubicO group peptidase (beta-lactamase class C family)
MRGSYALPKLALVGAILAAACGGGEVEPLPATESAGGSAGAPSSGGTEEQGGQGPEGGAGSGGTVAPGEFPDPDWPSADPASQGMDADALEQAAAAAEQTHSYCLLVIRHGKLVLERYWQGHDATTPQRSWSIAKSYSSALTGIAVERGDLGGLGDSVSQYLPEWQDGVHEPITLRHVLSMSSGLEWSAFDDYFVMTQLSQNHSNHAIGLGPSAAPGDHWTYHNGGVQILEPVFRAATGMTIEAYAEQHLWSRIGMNASWAHDPSGNPTAYASVMASCRDHARFGYLYLHGGQWKDEQVVPAAHVVDTLTPSQPHNRAYGLLVWLNGQLPALDTFGDPKEGTLVPFAPDDLFALRGFGNQFIDVIPSLDMLVVRFGPDPMSNFDLQTLIDDQRFETHDMILEPVLDAVVD